jgi:hypothetical protein
MSQPINLKEIEGRAWRSFFQDGLWDIYLGLLLLGMAVTAWLESLGMPESRAMVILVGLQVLSVVILWAGKRFITVPRIGRVRFGPRRKVRLAWTTIILVVSALVGAAVMLIALLVLGSPPAWFNAKLFFPAAWVVNALVVFSLGAYFLDFNRLYLIGVLYAIAIPIDVMLNKMVDAEISYVAFGIPAMVILVMGVIVLARFMRDYAVLPGGPPVKRTLDGG